MALKYNIRSERGNVKMKNIVRFVMLAISAGFLGIITASNVSASETDPVFNVTIINGGWVPEPDSTTSWVFGGFGAGDYKEGDVVTISAGAQNGADFLAWIVEPPEVITLLVNSGDIITGCTSFIMPAFDVTFTARWMRPGAPSSIIINNYPASEDEILGQSGAGHYLWGDTVHLAAGTRAGYKFVEWTSDEVTIPNPTQPNTRFMMPEFFEYEVTAHWERVEGYEPPPTFAITIRNFGMGLGTGRGASGSDGYFRSRFEEGETVYIFAGISLRQIFSRWRVEPPESIILLENPQNARTSFTMPAYDVDFTATWRSFESPMFPIIINNSPLPEGDIPGQWGTGSYFSGETVSLLAGTRDGYNFVEWTSDEITIPYPKQQNIGFNMPNISELIVTANWEPIRHPHTVTFDLNGGTHTGSVALLQTDALSENSITRSVTHGESVGELPRATPLTFSREGHRFTGWFEDIEDESTQWRDNKEVTDNVTLYARWVVTPDNFLLGDTTGDGNITSADATNIARYLAGHYDHLDELPICLLAADISGRGYITITDITLFARWLVGRNVGDMIVH